MKKINSIFIVDDDPIMVFGIRKMLNSIECNTISTFGNGKLAIDGIKKAMNDGNPVPEIIFLDINMPIMDGWQFLEDFVELPIKEKVRINIVTSSIDPIDHQNWANYNERTHHMISFNTKPVSRAEIIDITRPVE
ncbi:two-component system response regulator [Maribacter sp. HTCC2170]|uniref:response regulator n=1 Tax=Maribacter sp. (strain HTCC2170 / KCCM 42371) TaxID=313603 RepID=UPI00006B1ABA|nr:response regulator [Maribacter sp. HTCC2170]EAR00678.1 response regulator [Maribacter sp. HTCC2170]